MYRTFDEEDIPTFSIMDEEEEDPPKSKNKSATFWSSKKPKTEPVTNPSFFTYDEHVINLEEGSYGTGTFTCLCLFSICLALTHQRSEDREAVRQRSREEYSKNKLFVSFFLLLKVF